LPYMYAPCSADIESNVGATQPVDFQSSHSCPSADGHPETMKMDGGGAYIAVYVCALQRRHRKQCRRHPPNPSIFRADCRLGRPWRRSGQDISLWQNPRETFGRREFGNFPFKASSPLICLDPSPYLASTTQRNPSVPARSLLGAIKRYFPCSVNL